jgi:hypothetical protein
MFNVNEEVGLEICFESVLMALRWEALDIFQKET